MLFRSIDGARCTDASGSDGCVIELKKGPHSIALALEGNGAGSFSVKAGVGSPGEIALDSLTPDYGAATVMEVNDLVGSRNLGTQALAISRPWTSSPDTVTTSGGLTTDFAYEPTAPAQQQWGRLTKTTTPGGSSQSVSYYGDSESATDPCTGTSYPQAGLPKAITRYDGVTITKVYDASGLPVSQTTTGTDGAGEQSCTAYDAAGRTVSSTLADASGKQITSTKTSYKIGRAHV